MENCQGGTEFNQTIADLSLSLAAARSRCRTASKRLKVLEREREELRLRLAHLSQQVELQRTAAQRGTEESFRRLAIAVELKDEDTGAHLERIGYYAALIALACGHDHAYAAMLLSASQMHDIGKIGIPDRILKKRGRLTTAERTIMQRHAEYGFRILDGGHSPVLRLAAEVALTHHERYDGSGYPRGLAGEAIPLSGRIVAIADVFDALTMGRSYRQAMPADEALAMLEAGRGIRYDPVLLDAFFSVADRLIELRNRIDQGRPIIPSFSELSGVELPALAY